MKTYMVNEMFWSLQGEGIRAGEMSLFIRFTGCNLQCKIEKDKLSMGGFDCDTEFESGRKLTIEQIINEAAAIVPMNQEWFGKNLAWVVFTGGEPALQLDKNLIDAMHGIGYKCAIETNGSKCVDGLGLDWITVSPKVAEHAIRQMTATEIKYVRGYGQALPIPKCKAPYQLISPAFNGLTVDRKTIDWCAQLVSHNPQWRLSVQMHKLWGVR